MPDEKWVPPSHEDIERWLMTLPASIYKQGLTCIQSEEEWEKLEAEYDLKLAESLVTNKALNDNLTGPMLKALSIKEGNELRIKCITAKANSKRADAMHTQLDNRFTAVKKLVEFLKVSPERGA